MRLNTYSIIPGNPKQNEYILRLELKQQLFAYSPFSHSTLCELYVGTTPRSTKLCNEYKVSSLAP